MADWKQITARIRRARTGKDPAVQLSTLFEKTQDAMVAFELARVFEIAKALRIVAEDNLLDDPLNHLHNRLRKRRAAASASRLLAPLD